jgi:hypothetical protein
MLRLRQSGLVPNLAQIGLFGSYIDRSLVRPQTFPDLLLGPAIGLLGSVAQMSYF